MCLLIICFCQCNQYNFNMQVQPVQFQCATSTISMCNQYNFNVQPVQFQCATSTVSMCNQYNFNVKPVQFQCATSTISMCNQYNFNVQPVQFQCANASSTISKYILDLELVHFKLESPHVYSFISTYRYTGLEALTACCIFTQWPHFLVVISNGLCAKGLTVDL